MRSMGGPSSSNVTFERCRIREFTDTAADVALARHEPLLGTATWFAPATSTFRRNGQLQIEVAIACENYSTIIAWDAAL